MVIFEVFGELVKGFVYMKCIKGGVLVDGFNFVLVVVFNSFLNFIFS